jgi:hypothetical protein
VNVKTDEIIDILSANLEPVSEGRLGKTVVVAILAGGIGAAVVMLATVGPRASLLSTTHLEWAMWKVVLPLSVIALLWSKTGTSGSAVVTGARPHDRARKVTDLRVGFEPTHIRHIQNGSDLSSRFPRMRPV